MFRHRLDRAIVVFVALIAVIGVASAAAAPGSGPADKIARVTGGGTGVLTDPDGKAFLLDFFRVRGVVKDNGSARGEIRFEWRGPFAEVWGDPVCGGTCDTIVLRGRIQSGSVAPDGTVTLSGTAREVDKRGGDVVFDSDFDEPFSIVAGGSQGEDRFILQWCLLPEFQVTGPLRVKVHDHDGDDEDRHLASASSLNRASCSR